MCDYFEMDFQRTGQKLFIRVKPKLKVNLQQITQSFFLKNGIK